MSYINKINRNNTDYPLVALNSIVTTTSTIDTQIKVGSLDGFTLTNTNQSFKLYLPNGNSVADMKLNLNNLGAKDIKIYKGGVLGSIATTIDVGTIMELFYDGTQFIVIGNPIAQTTSEYTVLMDNTFVYNKTKTDSLLSSKLNFYSIKPTSSGTKTNLSINGGYYGKTFLVIESVHGSTGNATSSRISMIRCGYSGNNMSVKIIASDIGSYMQESYYNTYSVSSDGYLVITNSINSSSVMIISNR